MTTRNSTLLFCAIGFALLAFAPLGISSKFYLDILTLIFFTA